MKRQILGSLGYCLIFASTLFAQSLPNPQSTRNDPDDTQINAPAPQPNYSGVALDHLLVKFNDSFVACPHCLLRSDVAIPSELSPAARELMTRIATGARSLTPLFRTELEEQMWNVASTAYNLPLLQAAWEVKLESARAKNSNRTQRIPASYSLPAGLYHIYRFELEDSEKMSDWISELSASPYIDWVSPDYFIQAEHIPQQRRSTKPRPQLAPQPPLVPGPGPILRPNDPYFHSSHSWGQSYDDLWGLKKIHAQTAWQENEGEGILVAVIDTGLDRLHPDIANNVWFNSGERPFPNGIDDDGNGYIDDRWGWDFSTCALSDSFGFCHEFKEPDNDVSDGHGHGTHVSGTIAAVGNNGIGVIGIAPKARIMSLKALNDQGAGLSSELAQAILYAAIEGADLLNNSWGCGDACPSNPPVEEAVRLAYGLGAVVLFAAGNSNSDAMFRSPQNMPESIVVGASDPLDQRCDFSNFGVQIDLLAPGGESGPSCADTRNNNILSLRSGTTDMFAGRCNGAWSGQMLLGENYIRARGTSMAVPHASGAAALLLSKQPTLSAEALRQTLRISSADLGSPGFDLMTGAGRLDLSYAITLPAVLETQISFPHSGSNWSSLDDWLPIEGSAFGQDFERYQLLWSTETGPWISIEDSIANPVQGGFLGFFRVSDLDTGFYRIQLKAMMQNGESFQDIVQIFVEKGVRAITTNPAWQWSPRISQDWVVWTESRDGGLLNTGVYAYNLSSREERVVTRYHAYTPTVGGSNVVWQDNRNGNWDIYSYNFEQGNETAIAVAPGDQIQPAIWGNWVVWTDLQSVPSVSIRGFNLSTHENLIIAEGPGARISPAIWEHRVVWSDSRNGNPDIYLFDLNTRVETRITTNSFADSSPSIYGDLIAWTGFQSGPNDRDIYLYDLSQSLQRQLTTASSRQESPQVSDGFIVWEDDSINGGGVFVYDIETEQGVPLLDDGMTLQIYPAIWGNRVVWADYRNGNFDIYLKFAGQ